MTKEAVLRGFARVGYLSKSVVYATIGVLAAAAALNIPFGEVGGAKEAIDQFDHGTLAPIVLGLTGVGLVGYILWKLVQLAWDPEPHDDSAPREFMRRGSYGLSALAYSSVALSAVLSASGLGSGGGGSTKQSAVRWLAGMSYGRWIVMAAGAVIIGFGLHQAYKGYADTYLDQLDQIDMPGLLRRTLQWLGPVGHFGRAAVFATIGGLVMWAGYTLDPNDAGGTREALVWLASQPWGNYLLLAVGVAFVCYGFFVATKARYRRFDVANA